MKKSFKEKSTKIIKQINKFLTDVGKDHISEYSAQCAYYTILSFIPFVILIITLIQYTHINQDMLYDVISKIIPSSMNGFVIDIIKEVYSKSIGTISVSVIFMVWISEKGLYALIKGLHAIYNTDGEKGKSDLYLRGIAFLETILFIIIIAIGLVFLVFGASLKSILQQQIGKFENFGILSEIITEIGFIFGTFVVFLFLYRFMPNHKVTFKSQVPGAIFGAISLNIISFIFSRYLDIFKGFSIMYGSLTTLMLIMMWTYFCFYFIFWGAELNKIIAKTKKKKTGRNSKKENINDTAEED